MSSSDVRDHFVAAYGHATLADPPERVLRRGSRIRRARRVRRAATPLVVAGAVALAVTALPADRSDYRPGPVELVSYQVPAFPLALRTLPPDLSPARFSLDPDLDGTGPGVAHSSYGARDGGGSAVSVSVHGDRKPKNLGDTIGRVEIGGAKATVHDASTDDGAERVTVAWERREDQWVTLTGRGRYADRDRIVALAGAVVDRPTAVPLQLRVAPAGWEVVAYKEDVVITLADPRSDDRTRTLTVHIPPRAVRPADLPRQVEGVTGPLRAVTVQGRPAQLLPTADGWYLQATLADRTPFVLQAPEDLTQEHVLAVAAGISRR